jgi:molecular chaperone GrpE
MPEKESELKLLERLQPEQGAAPGSPVKAASEERVRPFRLEEPQDLEPSATSAEPTHAQPTTQDQPESQEDAVARADFDKLKDERDQLLDRLARLQAEFENARKRADRDRIADRDYATANVVEQFLPVLDNFELALKADGTAEQLRSGVELIVKKMEDVLRQLHVHPIPAMGEEFDPRHHEALGTVERLDLPDQHVGEEIRRGYMLRQRLLRPALVRVVSNPKQKSE